MRLARVITTAALAVGTSAVGYGGSVLGGSDAADPTATSSAARSTAASAGGDDTSASAFVDCMRSHGLADFPDVAVVDGRVVLDQDGTSVNVLSDSYRDAVAACASQLPEGVELPAEPDPPAPPAPPAAEDGEMPPTPPPAPEPPVPSPPS
jgi:hypothetical protein